MVGVLSVLLLRSVTALGQTDVQADIQADSQVGVQGEALTALSQGHLVVWFVESPTHPPQTNLQAIAALHHNTPMTLQEKTAGTFGQSASTFGQNSAGYGLDSDSPEISTPSIPPGQDTTSATPNGIGYKQQESGNFGQQSSTFGTESSNYGTTGQGGGGLSGSAFGTDASSYGTAASNHGQDVASFGNSTNTIADAGTPKPTPASDPLAEQFKAKLEHAFPALQLKFREVDPDELKDLLIATKGSTSYPDVLVGALPPAWWNSMQGEFGLAMLQPANFYPNGVTETPPSDMPYAILARAQHMESARAFALWMSEPTSGCPGCVQAGLSKREMAAAAFAVSGLLRLVSGQPLGDVADPQIARSSTLGVNRMLATIGGTSAGEAVPRVEVERASTNGSLAAVALRVVVSSQGVFGVAHPLMVLRLGTDGTWKVLQVSLNLPQVEQRSLREALMVTSPISTAEQRAGVQGVTLAAPQDGSSQPAMPDLVWDNNGGAGLQVVEWQRGGREGGWSDARLYLVQDRSPRLQTHVRAEFAEDAGRYRWRVWSVGGHGEMKITPWRVFQVVP